MPGIESLRAVWLALAGLKHRSQGVQMRKIEAAMVMAVRAQLNGETKSWRSGNTVVRNVHDGDLGKVVVVELHGNVIAEFDVSADNCREIRGLKITDAGRQTVTTKSRLNALLSCFYGGAGSCQVKGQWLLNTTEFYGTDWVSYGWRDNRACQQAEALCKPSVRAPETSYDVDWHRAMAESLAMAKGLAAASVLA